MTFGNRDGREYSMPWSEMYDCCRTGVRAEGYCRAFADAYTVFSSSVGLSNVFTMPASGKYHKFNHLTIYGVDCYVDVVIFDITNVCDYPDGLGSLPLMYAKIETDSSVYDEYYSIL